MKNKYYCPEVFLDVVSTKLTSTAVLFLMSNCSPKSSMPSPESWMSAWQRLSKDEVERFAKEDPKIKAHSKLSPKRNFWT